MASDPVVMKILSDIEGDLEKLEHRLYGNGQPGDIEKLTTRLAKAELSISKILWICGAIVFAINALTGSGIISLESLLKAIKH